MEATPAITIRDFIPNPSAIFGPASEGEKVYIRWRDRLYVVLSADSLPDTLGPSAHAVVTQELSDRAERANDAYRKGEVTRCCSHSELDDFLNSL